MSTNAILDEKTAALFDQTQPAPPEESAEPVKPLAERLQAWLNENNAVIAINVQLLDGTMVDPMNFLSQIPNIRLVYGPAKRIESNQL